MANILICDDEKDIVNALKIYLTAEGYQTFEAYNGEEALAILAQEEIHLVIMDIMMPLLDGISAVAKIREDVYKRQGFSNTVLNKSEVGAAQNDSGYFRGVEWRHDFI